MIVTEADRRIFYDDLGAGPPLLVIPGAMTDRRRAEQAQGLNWVSVLTSDGEAGYVAADFIQPAEAGS